MSSLDLLAASGVAIGAAGLAAVIVPPTTRLGARVRPYAVLSRSSLGHRDMPNALATAPLTGGLLTRLFGPPLIALVARVRRSGTQRGDDKLARLLRQAGEMDRTPDEYRVRQLGEALAVAVVSAGAIGTLVRAPTVALLAGVAGFVVGLTRSRRRLEREVTSRAARIRLELYTVNQLLAMHVRTGAGPMQAVQRLVDRGHGVVVGELADTLTWIRSGMGEAAAFRRSAELTPEPSATRTYQLIAAGVERGVDLAGGLLALSEDIRDARRAQLHKDAVRRRAAMLIPTIGILAPIMLLFIAAPLPSIVLGHR
jgi:Flp pilus assembly protein TadB